MSYCQQPHRPRWLSQAPTLRLLQCRLCSSLLFWGRGCCAECSWAVCIVQGSLPALLGKTELLFDKMCLGTCAFSVSSCGGDIQSTKCCTNKAAQINDTIPTHRRAPVVVCTAGSACLPFCCFTKSTRGKAACDAYLDGSSRLVSTR